MQQTGGYQFEAAPVGEQERDYSLNGITVLETLIDRQRMPMPNVQVALKPDLAKSFTNAYAFH